MKVKDLFIFKIQDRYGVASQDFSVDEADRV